MMKGRYLAMLMVVGCAAASQAQWIKWGTLEAPGFAPGTTTTMAPAKVTFVNTVSLPLGSIFGDVGQYFLEIAPTSSLTAYNYTGTNSAPAGVPVAIAGTYHWLLNNIQANTVTNSHLLGTSVAQVGGTTELTSTGVWDWYYNNATPFALSTGGYTGKFRVASSTTGELELQAEAVPEPMTLALGAMGLAAAIRRRRHRA